MDELGAEELPRSYSSLENEGRSYCDRDEYEGEVLVEVHSFFCFSFNALLLEYNVVVFSTESKLATRY